MQKSSRLSLRLQIRSLKNAFFQVRNLSFKDLLHDSLIKVIHQDEQRAPAKRGVEHLNRAAINQN